MEQHLPHSPFGPLEFAFRCLLRCLDEDVEHEVLAGKILTRMHIAKPQEKLLSILPTAFLVFGGRSSFQDLSRHSDVSEQTFRVSLPGRREVIKAAIGK